MNQVLNYFSALPILELIAVLTSLLYVVLAAKGNIWCWPSALISTALYSAIFYDVYLWSDSLLQIYYMAMAIFGWYNWRLSINKSIDKTQNETGEAGVGIVPITVIKWQKITHLKAISLLTLLSVILGWLMENYTPADFPYFDATTTIFAVFATYLVVAKVLENWLYWLAIDFVSIYLYLQKDLTPTAVLFSLYVILAAYGYYQWKKLYNLQRACYE